MVDALEVLVVQYGARLLTVISAQQLSHHFEHITAHKSGKSHNHHQHNELLHDDNVYFPRYYQQL